MIPPYETIELGDKRTIQCTCSDCNLHRTLPSTSFSKRARGITVFSHLKSLSFKKTTCVSFSCKLGSAHEWSGAGFELACFRLLVVGNERKRGRAREKNKHDGLSPPLLFLSLAFFFYFARPGKLQRAWKIWSF